MGSEPGELYPGGEDMGDDKWIGLTLGLGQKNPGDEGMEDEEELELALELGQWNAK